MITLKIDNDENMVIDQAYYLEHVAGLIRNGFTSGEGWEITGEQEGEPE